MITIPDALLRALGWTLAHALWQGALIAILLLVVLPRMRTAQNRYRAAYSALLLIFTAAVTTFFVEWEAPAAMPLKGFVDAPDIVFLEGNHEGEMYFWQKASRWLENNSPVVVTIWLIGFVFFLLRLGGGWWQMQRLRTRGAVQVDSDWQNKLLSLVRIIGVRRPVQLLESAFVKAPLTIGWLKPLVLLPVGFINRLSAAEVEAVLAHELAHIARRDWIFNLLQAFIETIFYYHPAVWWLSGVIRRERENACDDVALAATGNPIAFARALVQVQEMAAPVPALALALSGTRRRRPLLERVRRILNQAPQQQHQVMEKITATFILLALLALVGLRANTVPTVEAAFAQIAELPQALFGADQPEEQVPSDSLPKPKSTRKITREDENGRVEAEYKNGEITRLNIDGKEIPSSEFNAHSDLIEELSEEVPPPAPPHAPRVFWMDGDRGGVWAPDAPAPPGAPRAYLFGTPQAPLQPLTPLPPIYVHGSGISVESDKDKDGNTVIRLDNHGEVSEVIVKNGEIWVNGEKIEKGETFDLPGIHIGGDNTHFFYGDGDYSYDFGEGIVMGHRFSEETREQMNREMERAREEQARAMKEHRRSMERDHKRLEKEWKEQQKEWEKEQKRWEKEQEKWTKEQEKWQEEHRAWEKRQKAMQERLKSELLRDGLISDPNNFSLKINAKELKVNKKKQSEEMRRKYEEIIKSNAGMKLDGDDWNFNFNFSGDN